MISTLTKATLVLKTSAFSSSIVVEMSPGRITTSHLMCKWISFIKGEDLHESSAIQKLLYTQKPPNSPREIVLQEDESVEVVQCHAPKLGLRVACPRATGIAL